MRNRPAWRISRGLAFCWASCTQMQCWRRKNNFGGLADLTAIPAGADASDVFAFDTGPGNMVIDAVTEKLFGRAFDCGGKIAASGTVLAPVLKQILKRRFFR